jgi:hypothetical protein
MTPHGPDPWGTAVGEVRPNGQFSWVENDSSPPVPERQWDEREIEGCNPVEKENPDCFQKEIRLMGSGVY